MLFIHIHSHHHHHQIQDSTEMVEDLINNCEFMIDKKYENKRLTTVWIIKELTLNVSTLINIHLNKVIHDLGPTILFKSKCTIRYN